GSPSAVQGTGSAARSTSPAASPDSHALAPSWLRLLHARQSVLPRVLCGRRQGRNICAACLAVCGCIACPARQVRIDRHPFGDLFAEFSALAVSWELSGPSRFRRREPLITELPRLAAHSIVIRRLN